MRNILPGLVLALPLTPAAAAAASPACEERATTFESRDVSCVLPAALQARRFEFLARFSGGHDDTIASLQATLDERPLRCDDGSKTRLVAEDGDVSLDCRFSIDRDQRSEIRIVVTIRWTHAQYSSFELLSR